MPFLPNCERINERRKKVLMGFCDSTKSIKEALTGRSGLIFTDITEIVCFHFTFFRLI
jgi:hypothetical protein